MVLACAVALAACGKDNTGPASGTLIVNVIQPSQPAGAAGNVVVTGPGTYTKTVTATDTLKGLASGSYTVTAATTTTTDSLVSSAVTGTVTGSPATVSAGNTAMVTATYVAQPGTGVLWTGWWKGPDVGQGFSSANLAAGGTQIPADTITNGGTQFTVSAIVFDAAGNAWVTNHLMNQVLEYAVGQLDSAVSTPAITITFSSLPFGMAFDASGNLWVSFYSLNNIQEFTAAQLAALSGSVSSPTPTVTIASPGPSGVAFDATGNLWVSSYADSTIYEFTASAIGSGGSGLPSDSLQSMALALVSGLTFDSSGNLWAGTEAALLVNYTAAQLAAATPPTAPNQTIAASGPYFFDQTAFDNSGNLWASTETGYVVEYSPSQLASGGTPTPSRVLLSSNTQSGQIFSLAFNPHASGLPIGGERARPYRSMRTGMHQATTHNQPMILVGPGRHSVGDGPGPR